MPNQYFHVVKSINGGDSNGIASISEVTKNFNEWAGSIGKKTGGEEEKEDRRILGLWGR